MDITKIVDMMTSGDYKERFKAEYYQLKDRYEKLKKLNNKIEAATQTKFHPVQVEEPKHDCPSDMLRTQQHIMGEYLNVLEVRAVIENIEL